MKCSTYQQAQPQRAPQQILFAIRRFARGSHGSEHVDERHYKGRAFAPPCGPPDLTSFGVLGDASAVPPASESDPRFVYLPK